MQVEAEKVKAAKEAKADKDAENLAAANAEIDVAFNLTRQKQTLMDANKKAIKEKVTALAGLVPEESQAFGMEEQPRKALLQRVGTLAAEIFGISTNTTKISEDLRKELAQFRLRA